MSEFDIRNITRTSGLNPEQFEATPRTPDGISESGDTIWTFKNFQTYFGYYKEIPEVRKAINTIATWVLGKGYTTSTRNQVLLESMTGWGEDSFEAIMWNMLVMKKVNGDSFAEIIRSDRGQLINLKPLNPQKVQVVVSEKGIIKGYKYTHKGEDMDFKPYEILHLCNDRVADEVHGTSVIESIKWLIDARNEAMRDWRRISHRSTIRVLVIDDDNPAKLATVKTQYKEAIANGELLVIPGKTGEKQFEDLTLPPVEAFLAWIRYLENAFYKAIGVPKIIAGDAEGIPESGGKMAYLSHEPTYRKEVTDLESDIWNQLAIRVKFNPQPSLEQGMNDQESKNNNQTQVAQPQDRSAGGAI